MNLCVIGTGYVGLVAGVCLASVGNNVICVDNDIEKLKKLEQGIVPIYEPGLEELIMESVNEKKLSFSSDLDYAVKNSDVCFIAVGTPQNDDGSANLEAVFDIAKAIATSMNGYKVIVNKSTVPVGTCNEIEALIKANTNYDFDIVSNPEFLKQGAAVNDFLEPDRVIIGAKTQKTFSILKEIYSTISRDGDKLIEMDINSAEMTKYASNAFLAMKISFANEIANICEKVGANAEMVRKGMCADNRIGDKFLYAGLGYGGSCFPKDVKALISVAKENDYTPELLMATDSVNKNQRKLFLEKVLNHYNGDIKNKHFALWGLAFKPETNDMREAPAIDLINSLIEKGSTITAYDPKAILTAKKIIGDKILYANSAYEALSNADALILATEWAEFKNTDFIKIKKELKSPVIFDGRNQYSPKILNELGFQYYYVGQND